MYTPEKAGCRVKNLLHVLTHNCCIHPCHCPPRTGVPISALYVHPIPEPLDFASWWLELLRLPTAGTQGSYVSPLMVAWGSTGTERSFLLLYTFSFSFFFFSRLEYLGDGLQPVLPHALRSQAGKEISWRAEAWCSSAGGHVSTEGAAPAQTFG